jgi:Zn-dependent oligopeptidase
LLDLSLHMQTDPGAKVDVVALSNQELTRVWMAPEKGTAFVAYFGHLAGGYDAGYYGYMWSLAIAQDLASKFYEAPGGLLDEKVGRRLREEIYGAAASREAEVSVEKFLGRKPSVEPFLKFVGAK